MTSPRPRLSLAILLVTTALVSQLTYGEITNLLVNPSFEDDLRGTWKGNGFDFERYTGDAVDGLYSVKCSNRPRDLNGPLQENINFAKGRHYVFEGYVKLLSDQPGRIWQSFKAVMQMNLPGQTKRQSYIIAYRGFAKASQGWILLKGSIEAPMKDPTDVRLAIRGPKAGVDFLVDNLTLYEVEENPNWMGEAHTNIETYRKSNINFNLQVPSGVKKRHLELEIKLKNHLFAFGAKIEEYALVEEPRNEYTKLVYNLFNWATVQAYKWKFNKGGRYNPNFSRATGATAALLANGLKVRGHSIFWNLEKNVPQWVKELPVDELPSELGRHVDYMMNLTRGKLEQWDVQNEHIHGHYYEERLQNPNISKMMFRMVRAEDPNGADLYLNDFTCITSGASTEDLHDLAVEYLNEGVPLDGLGIQGHTKDFVKPDPTAMWRRIDRLAEPGLDLMMTEFDIGWPDVIERADWFEDSIRAFFGHPRMAGVILWGFWSGAMRQPHHELITGPSVNDLTLVESGERWACLTQKEWTTRETRRVNDTGLNFSLRGFQGDYEVIVKHRGVPVQRETFTLGKENATVNIQVTSSEDPINITEEVDYVPQCISHRAERTLLTNQTTTSSDVTLTCRSVESSPSGIEENDATSVTCDADEVMTSCSGWHRGTDWTWNGEKIEINSTGRPQCTAYNGRASSGGVKAQARCCKLAGLTCDYRVAGPSFPFDGAMAEARCLAGQLALGCSVYQPYPDSDGVKPNEDITSCLAQSGAPAFSNPAERSGVYAFSACCKAPGTGLGCEIAKSTISKRTKGNLRAVACPDGFTMTGCSAFAENGRAAGSKIVVRSGIVKCKVVLGDDLPKGSIGVQAYATCCRPPAI